MSLICGVQAHPHYALAFLSDDLLKTPSFAPGITLTADVDISHRSDLSMDAVDCVSKAVGFLVSERVATRMCELQPDVVIGSVRSDYKVPLFWIDPPIGIDSLEKVNTWTGAKVFKPREPAPIVCCEFEVVETARRERWKNFLFVPIAKPPDVVIPTDLRRAVPYNERRKDWIPSWLRTYIQQ